MFSHDLMCDQDFYIICFEMGDSQMCLKAKQTNNYFKDSKIFLQNHLGKTMKLTNKGALQQDWQRGCHPKNRKKVVNTCNKESEIKPPTGEKEKEKNIRNQLRK